MPESASTLKALAGLLLPCNSATAFTATPDWIAANSVGSAVAAASISPLAIACRIVAGLANSCSTTVTPARSNQPWYRPSTSAGLLQARLWPSRIGPAPLLGVAGLGCAAAAGGDWGAEAT